MDSSEVLQAVRTVAERNLLLAEIEVLTASLFNKSQSFEEILRTRVRASTAQLVAKLTQGGVKQEQMLSQLKESLMKMPLVQITAAVEPTEELITQVHAWLVKNTPARLIEFAHDPRIVAGAVVVYEGKYADFSAKKQLKETIESLVGTSS